MTLTNPNTSSVQTNVGSGDGKADQVFFLPVTPEYVEQVRTTDRRWAMGGPGHHGSSSSPLTPTHPPHPPTRPALLQVIKREKPLARDKVLLAMGYKRNTEEWYVAWLVLKYGSIRGAAEGVSKVAERLHKIAATAEVLAKVAA